MANRFRVGQFAFFVLAFFVLLALAAPGVPAQCTTTLVPGPLLSAPAWGLTVTGNGDVVVAAQSPTSSDYRILRWDGVNLTPLGAANGDVFDIVELPNGDLVIGGDFTEVGSTAAFGVSAFGVARLSAGLWSPLGGNANGEVRVLAVGPNGDLFAGGGFTMIGATAANRIARWDGVAWSALGAGVTFGGWRQPGVEAIAFLPNGDLIAGGNFPNAGNAFVRGLARWDGSSWSPMGTGSVLPIVSLSALSNGAVIAGQTWLQNSTLQPGVLRWNGQAWIRIGTAVSAAPSVSTISELPGGDFIVAGNFASMDGTAGTQAVARWHGSGWWPAGSGAAVVRDAAVLPNDRVVLSMGTLAPAGYRLLVVEPTCPATVSPYLGGCVGSAGALEFTATALPWLGSTFRGRATGLTANALAVEVTGLSSTIQPLPALLPQGVVGCSLGVSPDATRLLLPQGGVVETAIPIPQSANLVGVTIRQQVLAAELDAQGAIAAAVSTNALALFIGAF